jgi:hypothetical protein
VCGSALDRPAPDFSTQACKTVALIEYQTSNSITMRCPACGNRWSGTAPGTKPH